MLRSVPHSLPKPFQLGSLIHAKIKWKFSKSHYSLKVISNSMERDSPNHSPTATSSISSSPEEVESNLTYKDYVKGELGLLVSENGWLVRRMIEKEEEMRQVVQVQAQAFHEPVFIFDDLFFQFFQAEVLAGLLYRLKNSPPDRYACLIAESTTTSNAAQEPKLAGVVDITVLRDEAVLRHLPVGVREYVYVSGIAVLSNYRRQRVATTLLKGCDVMCFQWGYEYLVLRAYEDDLGARKLYANAGYQMVSSDPPWTTTWIGRKRRVLMIKRFTNPI